MRLSVISFTENGSRLAEKIVKLLEEDQEKKIEETALYTKCGTYLESCAGTALLFVETSVRDWAGAQMKKRNAMLFIGACGIAVRAIAPFLTDKLHDVPVLVMDELGKHVIPILSGHVGGANELALYLGKISGAEPVITTATDQNGKFAVDLFARQNGLFIMNKDGIAKISSKVLAEKEITLSIEPGYEKYTTNQSVLPAQIRMVSYPPAEFVDIVITSKENLFAAALILKPKEYVIGIGCKKGKREEEIDHFITKKMKELDIPITQISALASIFIKREEPGLIAWCRKTGIPFLTYTVEELQAAEGTFTKSSFVEKQVGVDNVCERAALTACGADGKLVLHKFAENGMTIAVAYK